MGKDFKIIGLRPSKGGDIITSLPILELLEQKYPNSYKTVSIAEKNSVFAQLLFNHPLIDRIHINRILEQPSQTDIDFYNSHDIIIPPNLQHPNQFWYNQHHMIEENFIMMGLNYNELALESRIPKLVKWFDTPKYNRTIAIWPMAGSGKDIDRGPTKEWYTELVTKIMNETNYDIFQFGHPDDFDIFNTKVANYKRIDFFEQIKMTLGCSLMIGTDAGSSLVMGAYGMPQITLLTNWMQNHISNFNALSPRNKNDISLFAEGGCDNISHETVLDYIKKII